MAVFSGPPTAPIRAGKSWRLISTIRRDDNDLDEPAIARFDDGRLVLVTRPDSGIFFSDDDGISWIESGRIINTGVLKAPRLFVLQDSTLVCVTTYQGHLSVFLSRDGGINWTPEIPLDPSCYGYPGGCILEDESLLISYCESGKAPNRVYVIRFRVNPARDGIEFLPIG
jgi:hypothetical protein